MPRGYSRTFLLIRHVWVTALLVSKTEFPLSAALKRHTLRDDFKYSFSPLTNSGPWTRSFLSLGSVASKIVRDDDCLPETSRIKARHPDPNTVTLALKYNYYSSGVFKNTQKRGPLFHARALKNAFCNRWILNWVLREERKNVLDQGKRWPLVFTGPLAPLATAVFGVSCMINQSQREQGWLEKSLMWRALVCVPTFLPRWPLWYE